DDARVVMARRAKHATWAGAIAALVSSLSLLGWALDAPALSSLLPRATSLRANTALGIFAAACSMLLHAEALRRDSTPISRAGRAMASVPLLVGGAAVAEYVFGIDLGIDQLL